MSGAEVVPLWVQPIAWALYGIIVTQLGQDKIRVRPSRTPPPAPPPPPPRISPLACDWQGGQHACSLQQRCLHCRKRSRQVGLRGEAWLTANQCCLDALRMMLTTICGCLPPQIGLSGSTTTITIEVQTRSTPLSQCHQCTCSEQPDRSHGSLAYNNIQGWRSQARKTGSQTSA